jgi:hypothetical protein
MRLAITVLVAALAGCAAPSPEQQARDDALALRLMMLGTAAQAFNPAPLVIQCQGCR